MIKSLLFVCLGNICRSPAAEAVFLHKINALGLSEQYLVDSAGTGAWHQGNQADSRMRQAAKQRGIVISSVARQITIKDLYEFDLILTMDTENLVSVKALAKERDKDSLAIIKPILSFSSKTNLREVPDPYYGGDEGFEEVLDLLEDACDGLLSALNSKM